MAHSFPLPTTAALLALLLCTAAPGQNPLGKDRGRGPVYAGRWSGKDIALELRDAERGRWTGTLTFDGKRYPCRASAQDEGLSGTFTVGADSFAFTATVAGDRMTLSSDGQEYRLDRVVVPADPAPVAAAPLGGVGVAIQTTDDGEHVIQAVKPDGPAARAGLVPGGKLRAVDGKSVKGLSREQLQAKIQGPVGSLVTLTVETDTEVQDVVLKRGALTGAPPTGAPPTGAPATEPVAPPAGPTPVTAPGLRPAQLPGGGEPLAADVELPGWLKPGVRVTYYLGSASIPGVSAQLVEDDNGNWIDPATNRRYASQQNPGTGGAGYVQLNVVHAGASGVAVEARNYILIDPQAGNTMASTTTSYVGDRTGLGEYWVHPARLAELKPGKEGGVQILRGPYPLEGRTYDSVSIKTTTGAGYTRYTYDVATGLCLIYSASTTGQSVSTIDEAGRIGTGAGVNTIVHMRFLGVRDLELPWAGQPRPQWLKQGSQFTYSGSYSTAIPGAPPVAQELVVALSIDRLTEGFGTARLATRLQSLYGAPQESTQERVVGGALIGGLYVSPEVLRRLKPDAVIDEDRLTRVRTVFAGRQGNTATIVEQGPLEATRYTYDLTTGQLVATGQQQSQGVATIQIQTRLVTGR